MYSCNRCGDSPDVLSYARFEYLCDYCVGEGNGREWLQPLISWAEGNETELDFGGAQVPKRLRFLLEDAFAWREERGILND